ncbi:hypothetical protein BC937DRAFT_86429 [Endogone sp. FLAS-F59071]|nr:hypothetical protein BC937DRAFT_86429 [Endogone sp. FLAS-F59071]|eukprot:RUS22845.1 hypothetical protein BC937DRAFT_86429 [Endogone sp. FLAS-F59071]
MVAVAFCKHVATIATNLLSGLPVQQLDLLISMSRKVITKQEVPKGNRHAQWPQREDRERERNNGGSRWHQDSEEEASDAPEEFGFGHAGDDEGHENDRDDEEEDEEDDEEEDGNDDEKIKQLQRSLAHIPFEKLAEIQQKVGMKVFHKNFRRKNEANANEVVNDDEDDDYEVESRKPVQETDRNGEDSIKKAKGVKRSPKERKELKRSSKNKPAELTSKRPVGRFREVVGAITPKRRDPRFDQLSGKLNQDLFEKSYSFLDEYKSSELDMLREQIRKEKDQEEKERLQDLLKRMQSREFTMRAQKNKLELKRQRKKTEMDLVKKGKKPFFLKKSDEKKLELISKFDSLKGTKNLDKILEKKRKRNAAKEHRHVPYKRQRNDS